MPTADTLLMTGKPVAEEVYRRLDGRIRKLADQGVVPGLAVVLVGTDPASQVYVNSKTRRFKKLGLVAETLSLPEDITEAKLLGIIDDLNGDERYHGLLVQLPLPRQIDSDSILDRVSPNKDVDGFHPVNLGKLLSGKPTFIPCTPQGILEILRFYKIATDGAHAVIVGRSNIVGKPLAALLAAKAATGNATVTVCHTGTRNLAGHTAQADILIVASGQPNLITSDMVKQGCAIIDVGINRIPDDSEKGYHITGDIQTGEMMGHAGALTPVPGGVGPMTVAMLVANTVLAAEISTGVEAAE